jgi:hypothetical protein
MLLNRSVIKLIRLMVGTSKIIALNAPVIRMDILVMQTMLSIGKPI